MKKFISICVIFIVAFMFFAIPVINQKNHYTITAQVIEVDRPTNTVTFENTETGNLWQADNVENVWYSDICTLEMNANWTFKNIYDDIIEKVTYTCTPDRIS